MATPCWEHMRCGKHEDCPAHPSNGFDCWTIEGTWCRGERQGSYDQKVDACRARCDYYIGVMAGSIKIT